MFGKDKNPKLAATSPSNALIQGSVGSTCTKYTFAQESSPTAPDGKGGADEHAEAATAVLALGGGADDACDAAAAVPAGI